MLDAVSTEHSIEENLEAPLPASKPIRGAEILMRALVGNGVDTIFGLPGGAPTELRV